MPEILEIPEIPEILEIPENSIPYSMLFRAAFF